MTNQQTIHTYLSCTYIKQRVTLEFQYVISAVIYVYAYILRERREQSDTTQFAFVTTLPSNVGSRVAQSV
jgi:hypothetical protein